MTPTPRRHHRARRPGFTIAELLVSLSAASVLMLGLMSALMLAVQTVPTADDHAVRAAQADRCFEFLLADTLIARAADASSGRIALIVPDQTGDAADDTVEYILNGDLFQRRINSGDWRTLLAGVATQNSAIESVGGHPARLTVTLKTDRDHVHRAAFELATRPGSAAAIGDAGAEGAAGVDKARP